MNSKKAKVLRKSLRAGGVDPTQREYVQKKIGEELQPTIYLKQGCGRFIYKNAKAIYKNGGIG
mgnify:FL=1